MTSCLSPLSQPLRLVFCSRAQTYSRTLPPDDLSEAGFKVRRISRMARILRSGVDRWCTTAIEIAKSNNESGCGRFRMSATIVECGWCLTAIRARFSELASVSYQSLSVRENETLRKEVTMNEQRYIQDKERISSWAFYKPAHTKQVVEHLRRPTDPRRL